MLLFQRSRLTKVKLVMPLHLMMLSMCRRFLIFYLIMATISEEMRYFTITKAPCYVYVTSMFCVVYFDSLKQSLLHVQAISMQHDEVSQSKHIHESKTHTEERNYPECLYALKVSFQSPPLPSQDNYSLIIG